MLLTRIVGQGRVCEILADDEQGFAVDCFFRRLNLCGSAAAEVARLSARAQDAVAAYCEGIERAFAERVPWELRLLGYRHEPWTPQDVILVIRLSGYVALAQSQAEIERLLVEMVQAGVSREHLEELFPGLLDELDIDLLRRVRLGERLVPAEIGWLPAVSGSTVASTGGPPPVPRAIASNNWVVSGAKTKSGRALLSNDPHLEGNRLPSVWQEIVVEWPGGFCMGATMPGMPAVAIGRNRHLAWGATYTFMDAVDSWVEDCRDGRYRRVDPETGEDRWCAFRVREETITRKKSPDAHLTFYENEHGVLDGDPREAGYYLATRWASGAGAGAASIEAVLDLPLAKTVAEGMDLVGRIETAWNWVLADGEGNIGYQMSGLMPRRREGANGLVPLPGWDPRNDWAGFVDHRELPREINPERGFIATANEDRNHLGKAKPITMPMGSHRAERISALLAERNDWDVESTLALQRDVVSLQAQRFMEVLRPLLPDDEAGRVLRSWDCRYDEESRGAVLFEHFYGALIEEVLSRVCGKQVARHLIEQTSAIADFYANFDRVLFDPASRWYGVEGRDAVMAHVARRALAKPARKWGEERRVMMAHLLFG
ncbi:MAG: penicillin acylase family protein, partial [Deltaproteobacteria bacterium]